MKSFFRANYLDASAIIKILVNEKDSSSVQDYFHNGRNCFRMTSVCFAEALGVLKAKYFNRKDISEKGYLNRSYLLISLVRDKRILVDEISLSDPKIFNEVESVVKKYNIDISDAFQIVTIKKGRFSRFVDESQSLLISADSDLAKAARSEGVKVWVCTHEPIP